MTNLVCYLIGSHAEGDRRFHNKDQGANVTALGPFYCPDQIIGADFVVNTRPVANRNFRVPKRSVVNTRVFYILPPQSCAVTSRRFRREVTRRLASHSQRVGTPLPHAEGEELSGVSGDRELNAFMFGPAGLVGGVPVMRARNP